MKFVAGADSSSGDVLAPSSELTEILNRVWAAANLTADGGAMSNFSDRFVGCMTGKNLPAPVLESANDVLEFIHQAHSAIEALGFSPEVTLAEFIAAAVAGGFIAPAAGATILEGGEVVGEVLAIAFLVACVACLVSAAGPSICDLFASNPPEPFVQEQLAQLGVNIESANA
jgi:hypothetical protein